MLQNSLSRLWFLSKGCKQVPPEFIGGKILWAHPDGYFLTAQGHKVLHSYSPSNRLTHQKSRGYQSPIMRHFGGKACHILMALAFYGSRPIFIGKNGNPYVGEVHHLINDPLDYRPANLLCWLDRPTHREADRRRRILEKFFGDLHQFDIDELRRLQDPRVTSTELFNRFISGL